MSPTLQRKNVGSWKRSTLGRTFQAACGKMTDASQPLAVELCGQTSSPNHGVMWCQEDVTIHSVMEADSVLFQVYSGDAMQFWCGNRVDHDIFAVRQLERYCWVVGQAWSLASSQSTSHTSSSCVFVRCGSFGLVQQSDNVIDHRCSGPDLGQRLRHSFDVATR